MTDREEFVTPETQAAEDYDNRMLGRLTTVGLERLKFVPLAMLGVLSRLVKGAVEYDDGQSAMGVDGEIPPYDDINGFPNPFSRP